MNPQQYEAFKSILPTLGKRHNEVIDAINAYGGKACVSQIASFLDRQLHQVSGRLSELCQRRIIRDSGEVQFIETTQRRQTVWELNYEIVKND
jgi:predicted transcriptional regulator